MSMHRGWTVVTAAAVFALVASPAVGRALGLAVSHYDTDRPSDLGSSSDDQNRRPSHDPIAIEGDLDLILPDTHADDDGIRYGNGTKDDPYVLANWRISSNTQDGIYVFNTTRHLMIRDVTVVQDEVRDADQSEGILVEEAANVSIQNVTVTGKQDFGIAAFDTPYLPIESASISRHDDRRDARDAAVLAYRSKVVLRDSRLRYQGGELRTGIQCLGGGMTVQNVVLDGFESFFTASRTPPPDRQACKSAVFEDNRIITPKPSGRNRFSDGTFGVAHRVVIRNNSGPGTYAVFSKELGKVRIESNELYQLDVSAGASPPRFDAAIHIRNNTFEGRLRPASAGLKVMGGGESVRIVGNRFQNWNRPEGAMHIHGAPFVARRNVFVDNFATPGNQDRERYLVRIGVNATVASMAEEVGIPYQAFEGNDFLRHPNDEFGGLIRYGGGETGALDAENNYWGPEPPCEGPGVLGCARQPQWGIKGNVDVDPWSTTPHVVSREFVEAYYAGPESDALGFLTSVPGMALVGGLAVAVAAAVIGHRRRTT